MPNDLPLYPYSAKEARERSELPAWRESFRENCACAGAIEISIREHFDGMHLKDGAVEWAVKQYGYKRVEHVLANTVQTLCRTITRASSAENCIRRCRQRWQGEAPCAANPSRL